jgi:hypothetical protein
MVPKKHVGQDEILDYQSPMASFLPLYDYGVWRESLSRRDEQGIKI